LGVPETTVRKLNAIVKKIKTEGREEAPQRYADEAAGDITVSETLPPLTQEFFEVLHDEGMYDPQNAKFLQACEKQPRL
jgi:hypothetical protein